MASSYFRSAIIATVIASSSLVSLASTRNVRAPSHDAKDYIERGLWAWVHDQEDPEPDPEPSGKSGKGSGYASGSKSGKGSKGYKYLDSEPEPHWP